MLGGVPTAFRPLRHRDFRLLWTGLAISLVGSGLWLVALAWQVIELGGGPTELSLVTALFSVGATYSATMVIWGTLLQRRVPEGLRGRVSSLDFFVSLALMPVSMAIAGPAGAAFGLTAVFLVAGIVPGFLAVAAVVVPRLDRDELAHPLDHPEPALVKDLSGSMQNLSKGSER